MSFKLVQFAFLLVVLHSRKTHAKCSAQLNVTRIIGGHDAKPGEFPYQVSLQWGRIGSDPFEHFCGGSILNERWILTAVHCLLALECRPNGGCFIIKAGKHDLQRIEATEQTSVVEKYFKHKDYTGTAEIPGSFDIGLVKLVTPLRLTKRVAKIALPQKDTEPTGQAILSGWGAIDGDINNTGYPHILQTVDMQIINREDCNRAIVEVHPEIDENIVDKTNICTGSLIGEKFHCTGDSGGPLVAKNENGENEVIGIVSWGLSSENSSCGQRGAPNVDVRVSYFIDWIKETMANN